MRDEGKEEFQEDGHGLVQCPPVARGEAVANHPVFEQCTMPQNPNQTETDEQTTDDRRRRTPYLISFSKLGLVLHTL